MSATDPGWSSWAARTFKTPAATSATITPESPSHGAIVTSTTPVVRWDNANQRVFYYEFQLSRDMQFKTDPATASAMVYSSLLGLAPF